MKLIELLTRIDGDETVRVCTEEETIWIGKVRNMHDMDERVLSNATVSYICTSFSGLYIEVLI